LISQKSDNIYRRSILQSELPMVKKNYSVYVYPNISRDAMGSKNPYIEHLKDSLNANGLATTRSHARNAFRDLIFKGWRSDMVIFNWIEDLPARKMGLLQTMVFLLYIPWLKIYGVSILWIKHNKISHSRERFALKKILCRILARAADHIIVHGRDADNPATDKMIVLPHPNNIEATDILKPDLPDEPIIDFLIWGSLFPYKGVLEFLQYVDQNPGFRDKRIHIVGKCSNDYWNELLPYVRDKANITLENKYVDQDDLNKLFRQSRFILFTYRKTSVISSGVLMDSLVACKKIIAPDCGAFADMSRQHPFVYLFNDFSEIIDLYHKNYKNYNLDYAQVNEFVARNSWYNMGKKIQELALGDLFLTPSAD